MSPTAKRRRGSLTGRVLGWTASTVLVLALVSALWVVIYAVVPPPVTATMIGNERDGITKSWRPLAEIDPDMVRAAIAAEDSKFCSHDGFDREAIEEAWERYRRGGRIRGGSTISQQTAKNAFLWQGGGFIRKGLEAWFTFLIETIWGKRRIMEVYLNVAETGIGTYGAEAGAQRYFGHGADRLSAIEAARIAAVLPLPKKRGAIAPKGFTRRYGSSILARMSVVRREGLDDCLAIGGGGGEPVAKPRARSRDKAKRQRESAEALEAVVPPPNLAPVTEVEEPLETLPEPEAVIPELPPETDPEPVAANEPAV